MRTIWKYTLEPQHAPQILEIPSPVGQIPTCLLVENQNGNLCMWLEVDDDKQKLAFRYYVVGTGWQRPDCAVHQGSAVVGDFVWHVYFA